VTLLNLLVLIVGGAAVIFIMLCVAAVLYILRVTWDPYGDGFSEEEDL
jgi:hypothetical protein